jgi:hypothetical protein
MSSWPLASMMGEPGWESSSEKSPLVAMIAVDDRFRGKRG